jgi:uncharacterized protein YjbI with pentapeptide repeats
MIRRLARFWVLILTVAILLFPHNAFAASSSAVTLGASFESQDFSNQGFSGQNLQSAEFTNVKLIGVDFSKSDLRGAVFNGANAKNSNFHGADFTNGLAYVSSFDGADLTDSIMREAIMMRSTFNGANIEGADFTFAVLDKEQVVVLCKTATGINSVTGASTRQSLGCP